jgi:PAS domain S-box-containing protein
MQVLQHPLQILLIEDDLKDAELIQDLLETEDIACEVTRVDTQAALVASLEQGGVDLILADYSLPSFDGISALKLAMKACPEVPFIFVSGTLGEEVAIEALKIGATDYVLKTRLSRLVPSVLRALREATERAERKRAEESLRQSETEFRQILDFAPQLVAVLGPDNTRLYVNQAALDYYGFTLEEWRSGDPAKYGHPEDLERFCNETQSKFLSGLPHEAEMRSLGKDGKYRWFLYRWNPLRDEQGRLIRWYVAATDIEDRKQAEQRLQDENVALREEIDRASMFEEIVGTSRSLQTVLSLISKVAPTDSSVLVTGETGTGKELVARAIHKRSRRSSRPFVSVNCAAIPRDLIGSELFGHEKGAFTGATQRRIGRFELAEGGTIFLDEIGELQPRRKSLSCVFFRNTTLNASAALERSEPMFG